MATASPVGPEKENVEPYQAIEMQPTHSLYDTIVYVKVNTSNRKFGIHKGLLCHHSAYFKAALTGTFKEAEGLIILDDDELQVLERFHGWLYTGKLLKEGETLKTAKFEDLLAMCVFADRRSVPRLHNVAVDTVIEMTLARNMVPIYAIPDAWNNTPAGSMLHVFLVDLYANDTDLEEISEAESVREVMPLDFVADVAIALYKIQDTEAEKMLFWENRCRWHNHEPTESPCETPR